MHLLSITTFCTICSTSVFVKRFHLLDSLHSTVGLCTSQILQFNAHFTEQDCRAYLAYTRTFCLSVMFVLLHL